MNLKQKVNFELCLTEVLKGKTYTQLSKELNYGVPYLSVQIRKKAKELNKEDLLNKALLIQKAKRNKSGVVKNYGKQYVNDRLPLVKEWKAHPKLSGIYISDNGLVKQNDKISIPSITEKAFTKYASVTIFIQGKRTYHRVHRLVLETYNPIADPEKFQVDHLDRNGLNNSVNNLQWVTGSENIKRSYIKNVGVKLAINSQGGTIAGDLATEKAIKKYQDLLKDRFISYNKGIGSSITYICKCCGNTLTESITNKAFRFGMDGVCGICRREYRKEHLNE